MATAAKRILVNAILAGAMVIALAYLGVPRMLGAHPFWAVKVAYIGIGFGVVIAASFWVWQGSWWAKLAVFAGLLLASAALTGFGKMRFAASYAEDFLAGRLWYFGWIAVVGFGFALLMQLLALRR